VQLNLQAAFESELGAFFKQGNPKRLGLAVSGGGDSMALLCLAQEWAGKRDVELYVATVNHGLRTEAAVEAAYVKRVCCDFGITHEVLDWQGWDGRGNLQDQARRARLELMGNWANHHGIADVATAHTKDDQAETVLMRLARGAGVDGLSAIPPNRQVGGVRWLRPLLDVGREQLRTYLRREGTAWHEDQSNDDPAYERVRIRQAMGHLAALGISQDGLAKTAQRMGQARVALEVSTQNAAKSIANCENGGVSLKFDDFFSLPAEIRRRLLIHSLSWVSGAEYGPRSTAISDLLDALCEQRTSTLQGCLVKVKNDRILVWRELRAVADTASKTSEKWDDRWRVIGPDARGLEVRALGPNGLSQCKDWRKMGIDRDGVLPSPAIWQNDRLIAAPLAGFGEEWAINTVHGQNDFISCILSH
jgi:tRNA(Ile)-lysidine synthase